IQLRPSAQCCASTYMLGISPSVSVSVTSRTIWSQSPSALLNLSELYAETPVLGPMMRSSKTFSAKRWRMLFLRFSLPSTRPIALRDVDLHVALGDVTAEVELEADEEKRRCRGRDIVPDPRRELWGVDGYREARGSARDEVPAIGTVL